MLPFTIRLAPPTRRPNACNQKTTKNRNHAVDADWTPFRAAEKMYKARFPPPSLANVLDLATLDDARSKEIEAGVWVGRSEAVEFRELKGARRAYAIPSIPGQCTSKAPMNANASAGLVVLPSFLSHKEQQDLIRWSLSSQARHPNPTNLDTHYFLPEEGLWNAHQDLIVQPRPADPSSESTGPRQLVNNTPASSDNFKTMVETPKTSADSINDCPAAAMFPSPAQTAVGKHRVVLPLGNEAI